VKAVRFEDGVVEVYLPELEFEKSRREILQEERAKKQPILRKEEAGAPEEGVDEAGTDDYEVVPTADGDVKLKKKKHEKESAEDEEEESEEGKEAEEKEEASSEKEEDEEESKDSAETTEEKKPKEEKDSEESSESTKESEEDEKKDQS
jgi:hypothetical protein